MEGTKPIKPLTSEESEKMAEMGLGMGVSCLSMTSSCDLLDLQIDPRHSSLVQLTVGSGYSAFKEDVRDWYKINRSMHFNINTPSGFPVKVNVGVNANRRNESRLLYTCEGEMIRTRTIRIVIGVPTETGSSVMDRSTHDKQRSEQTGDKTSSEMLCSIKDDDLQCDALTVDGDDTVSEQSGPKLTSPIDPSHIAETKARNSTSPRPELSSQASTVSFQQVTKSRLEVLLDSKTSLQPERKYTKKERIEICRSIIAEENRGGTHFISAIDLGAKVFYTETVSEKKTSSKVSATAGINAVAGRASAKASLTNQSVVRSFESGMTANIDPGVDMKTIKTVVTPRQEKVIGCDVSPVWLLVRDKNWRQAMKRACWEYVQDHTSKLSIPVISTGGPFVISCGNYFLKVTGDSEKGYELEGTDQCKDASLMYIEIPRSKNISSNPDKSDDPMHDPVHDPYFGFYIYHTKEKRSGIKMYLCADPEENSSVCLVTRIPSPNAYSRLYVEFPSTQSLAPVCRWSKEPLHLLRKTAYTKRRQYLVMTKTDTDNPRTRKLFFSSEPHLDGDLQSLCQFTIQNEGWHREEEGASEMSTQT